MIEIDWKLPYPSRRMPVMARNIVATSQPLAAQAGLRMLQKGGNAVDAAIATAVALTVVEPTSNGIGSDAFAIVWDGRGLHGLNASGHSPAAWDYQHFSHFESMPRLGWNSVTIPGAVSCWVALSNRFGFLAFDELFGPAIEYAYDGFPVSPITAEMWYSAPKTYQGYPEFAAAFLPSGRAPKIGEKFQCRAQAITLERIAETKGEAFYCGDLADKIVAHSQNTGGFISKEDLATHKADWVETISIDYHGFTLHEMPPNTQGIAALLALGILKHWNIGDYPVDSPNSLHLQIEAMKLALVDTHRYVSDPSSMDIECKDLLNPDYLSRQAKSIDLKKAQDLGDDIENRGDTVYLTTADAKGMMVSLIQSNFDGFGSGIVIPNTGISLQNRGACFNLERNHPNQVKGRKRPFHTIIPALVMKDDQPLMSFGVMGGLMQPQGHAQIMARMFDYHQNPQAACDAPRWQIFPNMKVGFEAGFKSETLEDLNSRGHRISKIEENRWFGGAQLIYKLADGYCGASDSRKDGQAVGF